MILTISCLTTMLAGSQGLPPTALGQSFEKTMIGSPPESLALDYFYQKYTDAFGIPRPPHPGRCVLWPKPETLPSAVTQSCRSLARRMRHAKDC